MMAHAVIYLPYVLFANLPYYPLYFPIMSISCQEMSETGKSASERDKISNGGLKSF